MVLPGIKNGYVHTGKGVSVEYTVEYRSEQERQMAMFRREMLEEMKARRIGGSLTRYLQNDKLSDLEKDLDN